MKQPATENQNPFSAAETFWKRCLLFFLPAFCLGAAGLGFMILPDMGESERRPSRQAGKNDARTKEPAARGRPLSGQYGQSGWQVNGIFDDLMDLVLVSSPNPKSAGGTDWIASGSLLGVSQGRIILRGIREDRLLSEEAGLADLALRPEDDLAAIAAGGRHPEGLLARTEDPDGNDENHLPFIKTDKDAALCLSDRLEKASWFELTRLFPTAKAPRRTPAKYSTHVEGFARRYALPPNLIYAIMEVESNFNPMAISRNQAMGLMQVVPHTAGEDVHAYLYGRNRKALEIEELFSPEKNIQYGIVYLHLLNRRHFREVKNPASREMCVIAAYNCGPSNLLRLFHPERGEALAQINRLSSDELYRRLTLELPSRENREYLPKVLAARNSLMRGSY
ncbi:MAG: transglycosylase SLT domain-containing protein [Desulfovibrionaceae bacterium]|nr:transglycosylase SLT domain-containing protein [Desulfovibrionaceae bacterium]